MIQSYLLIVFVLPIFVDKIDDSRFSLIDNIHVTMTYNNDVLVLAISSMHCNSTHGVKAFLSNYNTTTHDIC